jgi:hypothetical protein
MAGAAPLSFNLQNGRYVPNGKNARTESSGSDFMSNPTVLGIRQTNAGVSDAVLAKTSGLPSEALIRRAENRSERNGCGNALADDAAMDWDSAARLGNEVAGMLSLETSYLVDKFTSQTSNARNACDWRSVAAVATLTMPSLTGSSEERQQQHQQRLLSSSGGGGGVAPMVRIPPPTTLPASGRTIPQATPAPAPSKLQVAKRKRGEDKRATRTKSKSPPRKNKARGNSPATAPEESAERAPRDKHAAETVDAPSERHSRTERASEGEIATTNGQTEKRKRGRPLGSTAANRDKDKPVKLTNRERGLSSELEHAKKTHEFFVRTAEEKIINHEAACSELVSRCRAAESKLAEVEAKCRESTESSRKEYERRVRSLEETNSNFTRMYVLATEKLENSRDVACSARDGIYSEKDKLYVAKEEHHREVLKLKEENFDLSIKVFELTNASSKRDEDAKERERRYEELVARSADLMALSSENETLKSKLETDGYALSCAEKRAVDAENEKETYKAYRDSAKAKLAALREEHEKILVYFESKIEYLSKKTREHSEILMASAPAENIFEIEEELERDPYLPVCTGCYGCDHELGWKTLCVNCPQCWNSERGVHVSPLDGSCDACFSEYKNKHHEEEEEEISPNPADDIEIEIENDATERAADFEDDNEDEVERPNKKRRICKDDNCA